MPFRYFTFYSFDNNDMKSSKRHAVLLSLIFVIQYLSLKDFKAAEKMSLSHAEMRNFDDLVKYYTEYRYLIFVLQVKVLRGFKL